MQNNANNPTGRKAYVITGSTSGIGLSSSLLLASKVLSARPPKRLASGAAATFPRRRVRAVSGSLVAQRMPGADAYATSKQCILAAALEFATGVYYDDKGNPMLSSELVRDPKFTARVVSETRALLETVSNIAVPKLSA